MWRWDFPVRLGSLTPSLLVAATVVAPLGAAPPTSFETRKITASDAEGLDLFGISVALDGDRLLVGSSGDSPAGAFSGSAVLFERDQGGPGSWGQIKKLVPADGSAIDEFGWSVGIDGETAVVGSIGDDDQGGDAGAAYVFERDQGGPGQWGQAKKLLASDGGVSRRFGSSVAIDGDLIAVGASIGNAVYLFARDAGGAGNWGEIKKLVASDASGGDQFGVSVAVDGATLVVGARFEDESAADSGAAYVFERDFGGPGNWGEARKLKAADASAAAIFGHVVDVHGDTIVVGEGVASDLDVGPDTGAAYVFERDFGGPGNWGEVKKLVPSDAAAGDVFGRCVGTRGGSVVVGARLDDDAGEDSGSAWVFERHHGGTRQWGEHTKLLASDGAAEDWFGHACAFDGATIAVGAYRDDDAGSGSGAVYLFERTEVWIQRQKRVATDPFNGDRFAESVALDGDRLLVGVSLDDDAGSNSGSAILFERDQGGPGEWGQVKKLLAADAEGGDRFGRSVAVSGDTALVGAIGEDELGSDAGAAYLFERDLGGAGNWGQRRKLLASDGATLDQFGWSVALDGDTAVVGAIFDGDACPLDPFCFSGAAYVFERHAGGADNWGEVAKLTASDAGKEDELGTSVAIDGDTIVVGARRDDDGGPDSGAAYLFERDAGGAGSWGQVKKLTASDGDGAEQFGIAVAIDGDRILVGAFAEHFGFESRGTAYLFERHAGGPDNWGEVAKLVEPDGADADRYGHAVAVAGETALVGAPFDEDAAVGDPLFDSGSSHVHTRDTGGPDSWGRRVKLVALDAAAGDQFGRGLALDVDTAAIGAPGDTLPGSVTAGSVYLFERVGVPLPRVTRVGSDEDTGDGELAEGESTTAAIRRLLLTFSEPMADPPDDGEEGDVTNPESYLLVAAGFDAVFDTPGCAAGAAGDDVAVAVDSVAFDGGTRTATLELLGGAALAPDFYRLFACGTLVDAVGRSLDGDGDGAGGDDFVRGFEVLESEPPRVTLVEAILPEGDQVLSDGDSLPASSLSLRVTFSEPVADPAGSSDPEDVTNPANYLLAGDGGDGTISTASCAAGPSAADVAVPVDAVVYDAVARTATLALAGDAPLEPAIYLLLVCGTTSIRDLAGNALDGDGDGTGGDDFALGFTLFETEPPRVVGVDSVAGTGDGVLDEGETASVPITALLVAFDEAMRDPPGDAGADDVTNPANYRLVEAGADGTFETLACVSGTDPADREIPIDAVSYEPATLTATLWLNGGFPLPVGAFRLLVCGSTSVRDLAGNPLDGDGDGAGGDDFVRGFATRTAALELSGATIDTTAVFEACDSITAGDGFVIVPPGAVTFRSGGTVSLTDGFEVRPGASFSVEIDPTLCD